MFGIFNLFKPKIHRVPRCFGWMSSAETVAVNECISCPYGLPCADYSLKQFELESLKSKVKIFKDSLKSIKL